MNLAKYWIVSVCAMVGLLGCGGASSAVDSVGNSKAMISLVWPQRSRLIPLAANSIKLVLVNGGATYERLVTRPDAINSATSQIVFDKIISGNYQVTATSYPNADGTGRAQAVGTTSLSIAQGQTSDFNITMDSTIAQVRIVGVATTTSNVPTQYTAQAIDSSNYLVLVDPTTLQWTAGSNITLTGGSTVFSDTVTITGTAVGTNDLTLTYIEPATNRPTLTKTITFTGQIGVIVSPQTSNLLPGDTLTVNASVVNGTNPNVTWSVIGASTVSSTSTSIVVQAPNSAGNIQVRATSVQDATKSAVSTATVSSNVAVTVTPATASLEVNQTQVFTAAVTNTTNANVVWTVTGGATILNSTGTQATVQMPATTSPVTVKATSQFDTSKSSTATVTVTAATGSASGTVRGRGRG